MERNKPNNQSNVSKNEIKKRKRRKYPNVFFKKELTSIFNSIEDPKTMVASFLTFFCALRMSEICEMKWANIDLEDQKLKVVDGKNHKDGFVPISPVCIPVLKRWRAMNPNEAYLLPPESTEYPYLAPRALLVRFKKAIRTAGFEIETEKNARGHYQHQYKFHTLRHSRCTHLLNNGVPIQKVRQFMRHDRVETTMVYTWITNPELQKMVAEVDQPINNIQKITTEALNTTTAERTTHKDPLQIARTRLAIGEISPREFKRIIGILQTPMTV